MTSDATPPDADTQAARLLDVISCIEQAQRLREYLRVAHGNASPTVSLLLRPMLAEASRITDDLGALKDSLDAGTYS